MSDPLRPPSVSTCQYGVNPIRHRRKRPLRKFDGSYACGARLPKMCVTQMVQGLRENNALERFGGS